jgi:hypothetical protein
LIDRILKIIDIKKTNAKLYWSIIDNEEKYIMHSSACESLNLIEEYLEKYKDSINLKILKDIAEFNKIFMQWYEDNKIGIEECALSLPAPNISDLIGYQRNILFRDANDEYIVFMHKMKIEGYTPFHNHGNNTHVFVLPITKGLVEETYLHDITDFSKTGPVNLHSIGTKSLNAGEVSFGTGDLIHKVTNSSKSVQSFIEIYFPTPKDMKVYIPYYNESDKYLQTKPIQTNLPHHKALSKGESILACDYLLNLNIHFITFTSTEHVIVDKYNIESYYEKNGCEYIEKVLHDTYIIWSSGGQRVHDDL